MSGQQIGTVVGGVVGAVIGFYAGGNVVAGWQIGAAVGGMIGGAVDPTKIYGPHIGDGQSQSATDGTPISWVSGTGWVAGCICDLGNRHEVKVKDKGQGKGSGTESYHFEAHQSFAILVCESDELKGSTINRVLMVEQDGKIVYDVRPGSTMLSDSAKWAQGVTFLFGSEAQLPPTLFDGVHGAGNEPAYRGVMLALFNDWNLSSAGDRIPSFRFLVQSRGEGVGDFSFQGSSPIQSPWGYIAVPALDRVHQKVINGTSESSARIMVSSDGRTWTPTSARPPVSSQVRQLGCTNTAWAVVGNDGGNSGHLWVSLDQGASWAESKVLNDNQTLSIIEAEVLICSDTCIAALNYYGFNLGAGSVFAIYSTNNGATWAASTVPNGWNPGDSVVEAHGIYIPEWEMWVCPGQGRIYTAAGVVPTVWVDEGITTQRVGPCCYSPALDTLVMAGQTALYVKHGKTGTWSANLWPSGVSGRCDGICWVDSAGMFFAPKSTTGTDAFVSSDGDTWTQVNFDLSPTLNRGVSAAVYLPWVASILLTGTDVPDANGNYFTYAAATGDTTLAGIVRAICQRGGIGADKIDVSDLASVDVGGYVIAKQMNAVNALSPLIGAHFVYASEYDSKLNFHFYGADAVMTIDENDLVEANDANDGNVTQSLRNNATEFPRRIIGAYYDPALNYMPAAVMDTRRASGLTATGDLTMDIPVAMSADQAQQTVNKAMKVAYAQLPGTEEFSVPFAGPVNVYLSLVAGDPVIFRGQRGIVTKSILSHGYLKLTLQYDRQGAYTSSVQAIPGLTPTPPVSRYSGPTAIIPMNLPPLRSQDAPGIYVVTYSSPRNDNWRSAIIQMSLDAGMTWTTVGASNVDNVIGALTAADGGTSLVAQMTGDLVSVGSDQLDAQQNAAVLIHAGEYEVLQYGTATEDSMTPDLYTLTDLRRAEAGTAQLTGAIGDQLVTLDGAVLIPIDTSFAGKTIQFRAVGAGENADDATVASVVYQPDTTVIIDGGKIP